MGKKKVRGNGQGCAIRLGTNNWKAIATIGYTEDGRAVRKTKNGFATKSEALAYISTLKNKKDRPKDKTLKAIYDEWLEKYRPLVATSTIWCYISGFRVWAKIIISIN